MGTRKFLLFGVMLFVVLGIFLLFRPSEPVAKPPVSPVSKPAESPKPADPVPAPAPTPAAVPALPAAPAPAQPVAAESPKPATPSPITEATLVNTKWGPKGSTQKTRGQVIQFEFAPDHVLKIGGAKRAKWKIDGQQIVMYSDDGETHVLDIANGKIMFQGEELEKNS